jgi:hypothetical protein
MSNKGDAYQRGPLGSSPDISELGTTLLAPLGPRAKTNADQVAQYEAEIRRLAELADAVDQAVTALVIRLHMASDPAKREALEHSRADLQRFKDELESVQTEHQRTIERIQSQE